MNTVNFISKAGIGALAGFVGLGYWFGYQLLEQQGRLLLRLEALEQYQRQHATGDSTSPGLPLGSMVHDFDLPTLAGGRMTLSQWRGGRVLLIFIAPDCGFSRALLRELAALPADTAHAEPRPLLVSSGDADANRRLLREVGGEWPVVLQEDTELAALYQVDGSPMGYVVDEHGATGSERASGASAVLELARSDRGPAASRNRPAQLTTRPLARSQLNRNGLPAGTPAPTFRLPSLAGGEVALEEYRGHPLLLVFSDPTCEPCDRLAPELERVHQRLPGLQVLMISRGDLDANRAEVAQNGLTFPVVLQRHWEVSRAYGMFATPIAYLIDARGVITADVAVGIDAIRRLVLDNEIREWHTGG